MKDENGNVKSWRWMNESTLVEDHGSRRAILTASSHNHTPYLAECGEDGLLHRLNPKGSRARMIAAAPKLLAFARSAREALINLSDSAPDLDDLIDEGDEAIEAAEAVE